MRAEEDDQVLLAEPRVVKRAALRAIEYVGRFAVSVANFGLLGALRVHLLYLRRNARTPVSVPLKPAGRRLYFRGACDRGVVSHFWTRGYRIRVAPGAESIRYIIDAGANIGDESIRFRHFHPDATVLAVEADAGNFEVLKLNAAADSGIRPVHAALWPRDESVAVVPGAGNENFRVRAGPHSGGSTMVASVTIDHLMQAFNFPHLDILKLDIEGAEKALFEKDACGWLPLVRALIFEPPDRDAPFATMQIFRRLEDAGLAFNAYVHGENIILIRGDVDWTVESDIFLRSGVSRAP